MIFRSPYPEVEIPQTSLTSFALRHAARLATKPALIDGLTGRSMTFEQVEHDVQRVAAGLMTLGYRKGDVFGFLALNSIEFAIAFHAVASIGGIAAPINPSFNVAEVRHQLESTGACCLFIDPKLLDFAREATDRSTVRQLISFGDAPGTVAFTSLVQSTGNVPDVSIDPREDVVAILCSSGTTGLPKGVQITHYNLVAGACLIAAACPIGEHDILPGHLPFFHMFGLIKSVIVAPSVGCTGVVIPRFDLQQFLQIVQDYGVTRAYLVPPMVLALAKNPIVDEFDVSSLVTILCGAAPLGEGIAQACAARLGCRVKQAYGMTEIMPTHWTADTIGHAKPGSVGPCAPNTECKVIDLATGEELGSGQVGEILARGPQMTKGYLNRPDATAELIDPDGWVHTGDIGSVDAEGFLTVIDRLKELIKYKAFQVAPAELEAVLLSHPAVADVAVVRSPDDEAGEVPKAFVVLKGEATAEELMAFVAERVASYKKVRRLEFVEQIPKSPSGKILRRVLVEQERNAALSLV